jgi:predicted DNA-binding protein
MKKINLFIEDDWYKRLKHLSAELNTSMSHIIRNAIREHVGKRADKYVTEADDG